ncbi:MAG: hypothetical protein JXA61_00815 [Bacteroidales bacterium]|nr:hypothetical protein [Bacteroidales bacterium]
MHSIAQIPRTTDFKPYRIINLAFAGIILLVFLYAAFYPPESSGYPIFSFYERLTSERTISSGLSRSFSAVVRLDFSAARDYNPYSLRVFSFFLIQFVFRLTVLFMPVQKGLTNYRILIIADALQAVALFVVCFWPFLVFWTGFIIR